MNTLLEAVSDYMAMRRSLGFKLRYAESALCNFVLFLEEHGVDYVTTKLALDWAQLPATALPAHWAQRLCFVRAFAQFRSATDSRTEVPPCELLPHRAKRERPHIYSDQEIEQILTGALTLPGASVLKQRTYHCLLGLLVTTGLRISEVVALKMTNVDLDLGILTVEDTKFGKSRLVPVHATTEKVLRDYICFRNDWLDGKYVSHLFTSDSGHHLFQQTVRRTFYAILQHIGFCWPGAKGGPRLQDFRHSFAIAIMLQWYRNGEDVERRLPLLSTYLGHVKVTGTYWYLTAHPELMAAAAKRLEKRWEAKS